MLTMCVYQLADLTAFVWTFFDQCAIGSEEVLFKEAVEFNSRTLALRSVNLQH